MAIARTRSPANTLREWQDPDMDVPLDTTDDTYRAQIEAYRKMGGPGRVALVFRLNDLAREAAIAGIRARHPDYDDARRRLAYARLVLGDDLTRKVWPQHDLVEP
jgi:hypothetical protein